MKPLSVWTYLASLAAWLSLCLGAATVALVMDMRALEERLARDGDAYADHLNQHLVSSETVLKGFSALFGAVGTTDPAKVARYVDQMVESNPQIFALEIVRAVPKNRLEAFIAQQRSAGDSGFTVKSFSYDSDRRWVGLEDKPIYYPIVFMAPMPAGSEEVLGLDVDSVPVLQKALFETLQRREPVASHPFRLVEGNLAYVVFYPITCAFRSDASCFETGNRDELVVNMVIDADRLARPGQFAVVDGASVQLFHRDFSPDDPRGQLLAVSGAARSLMETSLLPAFDFRKPLKTMGEPLILRMQRQMGWEDINWRLLALISILTLLSSFLLVAYLREHQQGLVLHIENQQRLWQLANHDALTGLPNRMLLNDRLEQALAQMARQGARMAVLFLDLDDFKQVNDSYGHEAGDQLLKLVAERMRSAVRLGDTVGRLGGDEFIILIEGADSRAAAAAVSLKIRQKLAEGFQLAGRLVRVRASTGIAMYPEDGATAEALIGQADKNMYEDKKNCDNSPPMA